MSYFMNSVVTFSALPKTFGQRIKNFGNTSVGKLFLKDAKVVKTYNKSGMNLKTTNGIAMSGKTLRRRGMAAIGTPLVMYGGYKLKRKYDQYKPEIKMLRAYNNFKNKKQGV